MVCTGSLISLHIRYHAWVDHGVIHRGVEDFVLIFASALDFDGAQRIVPVGPSLSARLVEIPSG
jgi:hypothetical protein